VDVDHARDVVHAPIVTYRRGYARLVSPRFICASIAGVIAAAALRTHLWAVGGAALAFAGTVAGGSIALRGLSVIQPL
jgi:hypothetical protein